VTLEISVTIMMRACFMMAIALEMEALEANA
jgi:hypothetical protein